MNRNRNDQRNYSNVEQRQHPYRNRYNDESRRSGEFYDDRNEGYGDNYNRQGRYDMDADDYFDDDYDDDMRGQNDDRHPRFSNRYEESYDDERNSDRRGYREFQPTDNRRNYMSHPRQEGIYQSNEYGRNRDSNRSREWDMNQDRRSNWGQGQYEQPYARRGFASRSNWNNNRNENFRYGYDDQRYSQNQGRRGRR